MNTGRDIPCCGERTENLTEILENNSKQIRVMTERANDIKNKIDGICSEGKCCEPCNIKNPGIPGLYKQALDNTNLLAELYEVILTIDSRL